jgi:hypothetical protein
MKKMFLDIETVPAEETKKEILQELYQRKQDKARKSLNGNLQTFEEYVEATGLDGTFGRIVCLSYGIDDGQIVSLFGGEKEILTKFWEAALGVELFVGFNVMDFDLRFIYQRSVIFGVKPTVDLSFAKFKSSPIYDVMHEWSRWSNLGRTSLHGLAKALGLQSSKEGGIEGRYVAKAFAEGRIKEICEYCERDVELTREIYKKMTFT